MVDGAGRRSCSGRGMPTGSTLHSVDHADASPGLLGFERPTSTYVSITIIGSGECAVDEILPRGGFHEGVDVNGIVTPVMPSAVRHPKFDSATSVASQESQQ